MSPWQKTLARPPQLDDCVIAEWFTRIAERLLNASRLHVAGTPHRFTEIEFYDFDPPVHPDPFTHRDPIQWECGRWYFHRTGGVYRNGSFKGFDLTFGDGNSRAGILIRGLETPDGKLIDGPSLCVDYLLKTTHNNTVRALDFAIGERVAWDPDNPLYLADSPAEQRPIYRSARVGLSLKRSKSAEATNFILRPYRYLTEPRRIAKGKPYLILALHAQGMSADEIRELTGGTRASVTRYLADFASGRDESDFQRYFGQNLTPADLCRLHGTWHRHHATTIGDFVPGGRESARLQ
jgi:hypothetical protein